MLQDAYFLAKIGADTAENEQHFAEILPTFCQPTLSDDGEARPPPRRRHSRLPILKFDKICKFCDICKIFAEFSQKLLVFQTDFLRKC